MKVRIKAKSGSSLTPSKAAEILHDGTAQGHPLTPKQRRFMGWKSHQKAEYGASLSALDGNTVQFHGPSHEQGGIGIGFGGKRVEVEGNETGYISPEDNSLHIMGNMTNPLTGKKFKEDSKILANKERRVNRFIDKGSKLVNESDPKDKWEALSFNSGKAMLSGGIAKQRELQQSKEHLATIQKAMLDTANEIGADPQEFSKGKITKAKYGAVIADAGDYLKKKVPFSRLKASNPSYLNEYSANPSNYTKDVTVSGSPLRSRPSGNVTPIYSGKTNPQNQPPSSLNRFQSMSIGNNQSYDNGTGNNEDQMSLNYNPSQGDIPSNAKGLSFGQILPELYTAATNKQQPVFLQQYNPQLYAPYQVSFQDRRNQNSSTFRALSQKFSDNPAALASLAAQKYEADNQVNADEFRTNQQISSDIRDKNVGLLNDAQAKNLALADTQYTRQTQAKANTKELNSQVLKSIADKLHQNELEQRTLKVYENLYDYRMNPQGRMQYYGVPGKELMNYPRSGEVDASGQETGNSEQRVVQKRDNNGNLVYSTVTTNPSSMTIGRQVTDQEKAMQLILDKYKVANAATSGIFNRKSR